MRPWEAGTKGSVSIFLRSHLRLVYCEYDRPLFNIYLDPTLFQGVRLDLRASILVASPENYSSLLCFIQSYRKRRGFLRGGQENRGDLIDHSHDH
jgi:hypothetical protein